MDTSAWTGRPLGSRSSRPRLNPKTSTRNLWAASMSSYTRSGMMGWVFWLRTLDFDNYNSHVFLESRSYIFSGLSKVKLVSRCSAQWRALLHAGGTRDEYTTSLAPRNFASR